MTGLCIALALVFLSGAGQGLLAHICRMSCTPLRRVLLLVWFPLHMVGHLIHELRPTRYGGHPHKSRLLTMDYYSLPVSLFVACWQGWFVPE